MRGIDPLKFLCHGYTYLHKQVFFLAYSNLETLQSQQIFTLPFPNDNVSKPSWVCPAHLVLITVPFFPSSFFFFFSQSRYINLTSLISETDEVQLTILGWEEEETSLFFPAK